MTSCKATKSVTSKKEADTDKESNAKKLNKDSNNYNQEKKALKDNIKNENAENVVSDLNKNINDFEYGFLNDGDIEFEVSAKDKYSQKILTNEYATQTDPRKYRDKPQEEAKNSIKENIFYSSKGGIILNLEKNEATFLGEGLISQKDMMLKAARLKINWDKKLLKGIGKRKNNTLWAPPVMNYEKDYYLSTLAMYNTESDKAYALNIITPQKEGIFTAKKFKKVNEKQFYVEDASFSTCRLEDPHFSIDTKKAKIIKDDRAITGLFNLTLGGIKTPLGFFYSVFRITDKRESGFLFPEFGLNPVKGFYMNEFGYFFAINDYMGLAIKSGYDSEVGNIYFSTPFDYAKKYSFKGKVDYQWKLEQQKDVHILHWLHTTEPKSWGYYTINVNYKYEKLDDPKNYKSKYKESEEDLTISSDVSFNFPSIFFTPYDMTLNLHHDKRFGRKIFETEKKEEDKTLAEKESEMDSTRIVIPDITLKSKDFYILNFLNDINAPDFLTNINFSHTLNAKYERSRIRDFGKFTKDLFDKPIETLRQGRIEPVKLDDPITHYGIMHTIPVATNFTIFNHFIVTPHFTWKDRWYFDKFEYEYNKQQKKIVAKKVIYGFQRVGEYNTGGDIQTTFEFRHLFDQNNFIQAIRHKVNPVLGFNFSPGYGYNKDDYFQKVYNYHTKKIEKKYKFDNLYGEPTQNAQAILSLNLKNSLELKVKGDDDSSSKIIKLLKSFDLGTGYDFIAEKYKLQNFTLSASTSFWDDHINIKTDIEIDPYMYGKIDGEWEKLDDFAWNHGKFLGDVRDAKLTAEFVFKPEKAEEEEKATTKNLDPRRYVEFDVPWNLRLSYNIQYHKESPIERIERNLEEDRLKYVDPNKEIKPTTSIIAHNIHLDGDIDLTKKWKLGLSVLYNIKEDKFEDPRIKISRDLHCWVLSIDWVPLSYRNSFDFVIRVKANLLKSIKYRSRGKL